MFAWFSGGFSFCWTMNLWIVLGLVHLSWHAITAIYLAGIPFDLMHALANVFFLALFGKGRLGIIRYFQKKYGL